MRTSGAERKASVTHEHSPARPREEARLPPLRQRLHHHERHQETHELKDIAQELTSCEDSFGGISAYSSGVQTVSAQSQNQQEDWCGKCLNIISNCALCNKNFRKCDELLHHCAESFFNTSLMRMFERAIVS